MEIRPGDPLKIKPKAPDNQFGLLREGCTFCVSLQRHLNGTDTSFSLEDLFQLLSSQPENSLEVIGTLAFILAGTYLH